jgi:hypothetical protein
MGTYSFTGTAQFVHVTATGVYTIAAYGASGGNNTQNTRLVGGDGGLTSGEFNLTAGETLEIVVGGEGQNGPDGGGGGGGTFILGKVTGGSYTLLEVAGGGGGAGAFAGGATGNGRSNAGTGVGGTGGVGFPPATGNNGGGGGGGGAGAKGSGAAGSVGGAYAGGGGGTHGGGYYGGAGGAGSATGGFGGGGGAGYGSQEGGGGGGGGYTGGDGGGVYNGTYADSGGPGTFYFGGAFAFQTDTYQTAPGNGKVVITPNVMTCFAPDTLIRTACGDRPVKDLAVGDLVVTTSGAVRPVKWLGHRDIDCRRYADPTVAWPIRIAAHALGEGRPARDLHVSPGHAICVDIAGEVLIPAAALINGSTVQQVELDAITYWHVELDSHDILLAENLPAETYLDMGNRDFFIENALTDLDAGPDATEPMQPSHPAFCRPFHVHGPIVEAVRDRMRARALALGWNLVQTSDLHLLVDGNRIEPGMRGQRARFAVPPGAQDIWLVSSASRPLDVSDCPDGRNLGVCVTGLSAIGGRAPARAIALDDPFLCIGFHPVEDGIGRWTTGRARLPITLFPDCEAGFSLCVDYEIWVLRRWSSPAHGERGERVRRHRAA